MSRLLLDTNILLDAVMRERPQSAEARQVLDRCNGWGDMGLVAAVSLKDLYYVLGKCWGEPTARECVEQLMGLVVVAPVGGERGRARLRGRPRARVRRAQRRGLHHHPRRGRLPQKLRAQRDRRRIPGDCGLTNGVMCQAACQPPPDTSANTRAPIRRLRAHRRAE